jgi:hypothetical protein
MLHVWRLTNHITDMHGHMLGNVHVSGVMMAVLVAQVCQLYIRSTKEIPHGPMLQCRRTSHQTEIPSRCVMIVHHSIPALTVVTTALHGNCRAAW